eukprot:Em0021g816a
MLSNPSANSGAWFPPYQQPFPPVLPIPPPPPSFYDASSWSTVSQTTRREPTPFRGQGRGGRWHKRAHGGINTQRVSTSQDVNPPSTQEADFNCCGKTYKTSSAYQSHLCTHKKCDVCEYTGSGKALKDHALLEHYIPDELKFDSPEEIQKWKEARKRNYPTATHVAKKQKLASERRETGAVAETPLHRYINHIVNSDRGGRRGWGRGSRRPFAQRGGKHWRGRPTTGTSSQDPWNGHHGNADDAGGHDEDVKPMSPAPPAQAPPTRGEDCTAEGWRGESGQSMEAQDPPLPSGDDAPCPSGSSQKQRGTSAGRRKNSRVKPNRQDRSHEQLRKPTLLEKLLAAEIRKEQNAILQCIRYIVKKNFLRPANTEIKSD